MAPIDTMSSNPFRILIINPNSTENMTEALKPVVNTLPFRNVSYGFLTCPANTDSVPSINSPSDAVQSTGAIWETVKPLISQYDGFLVACYSRHPLVSKIREHFSSPEESGRKQYVTGIFESSIVSSLTHLAAEQAFGIVTTGQIWEENFNNGVNAFLGIHTSDAPSTSSRFIATTSTGLSATQLHGLPLSQVHQKMKDATKELLKKATEDGKAVGAVCLGCAGMVGLEGVVRKACCEELGNDLGQRVKIIDGVVAGIGVLVAQSGWGF